MSGHTIANLYGDRTTTMLGTALTITVLERACLFGVMTEDGFALNGAGCMIATEW
jgi:hypothetical protein